VIQVYTFEISNVHGPQWHRVLLQIVSRAVEGGHGHEAVVKLLLEKGAEKPLNWGKRLRRRC
jgi:hypothetical protein